DLLGFDNLGEDIAGADISGGGAPFLTVKGMALLTETLGKFGFLAPVAIFLPVLIGTLSFNGISSVFGTIFCRPLSLIANTTSAKGLDTGCDVVINT
ncbi:hypothetical protein MGSAQ_002156, partial [marine sediment metagenome]